MATFKVCLTRMVGETAVVSVEASSVEDARDAGLLLAKQVDDSVTWSPGDTIDDVDAYAVMDGTGEVIWER